MNRTAWLQDRTMKRFIDVFRCWERGDVPMLGAGELLGGPERQFRRCLDRYEEPGLDGLVAGRVGKSPPMKPYTGLRNE